MHAEVLFILYAAHKLIRPSELLIKFLNQLGLVFLVVNLSPGFDALPYKYKMYLARFIIIDPDFLIKERDMVKSRRIGLL